MHIKNLKKNILSKKRLIRIFDYFNYQGIAPDEREKRRIAVLAFIIAAIVFIPISIYHYIISSYTTALFNAVTAVVTLIIFIMLRFFREGKRIYRIAAFFTAVLLIYNIYTGGEQGGLAFWSFIFPLGTFFMFGIAEGIIWNGVFLLSAVSIMYLSRFYTEIYFYSGFPITRFAFSYIIVSLLTIGYESARSATLSALIKKQKKLNSSYNKMKVELELSKKIQKNIIPGLPPVFSGLQIASLYKPLGEIGGDFFDYLIMTSPKKIGFFISDVTGHGVPSALITSMLKILISTSGERRENPSEMLSYINSHLYEKSGGFLTTAFYCIYDPSRKMLSYARGGHCFPYLIRSNSVEILKADGYIIGAKKKPAFETKKIQLQEGDKILLFTDGLTEAENKNGMPFEAVIADTLLRHSLRNINEFVKNIFNEGLAFRGGATFEDDVTIIGIELIASKESRKRH
ncbi:MAG TPA: SpoIIE family protein phosphatase [Spirochaetota bacterium]|nr:SpoIIE family protein phosphatase [Spirochaetota bacterium]